MNSVFIARQPADKSKAEKRISRLAKRTHSDARARRAPGQCTVTVFDLRSPEKKLADLTAEVAQLEAAVA